MRRLTPLLLLAGCSTSTTDAALKVTVHFGTTPAQCAQVNVVGKDMKQASSTPLMRGNSDLVVGILETADLGSTVDVQAVGYAAADCSGGADDQSSTFHETYQKGKVDTVTLSLDGQGGGGMGGGTGGGGGGINDGGGGVGGGTGGGGVIPPETNCSNGLDDDSDALIDCFDSDCNGLLCDGGAVPSTCQGFMCKAANVESNCANHTDDNGDGTIDCADPTCANRACDDSNDCTTGDACKSGVCTPSGSFSCSAANECQVSGSGMCLADGGCGYTPMPGSCDGGSCTSGVCLSAGFPYTPSSFDPQLDTAFITGPIVLNCGVSTYDSTFGTFTNWCNQPQPLTLNQFRAGEPDLALLAMQGLQIAQGSTLQITGTRPVVLAVYGDATIDGTLTGSADHDNLGTTTLPGSSCYPNHLGGDGFAYTQAGGGGGAYGKNGSHGGDGTGNTTGGSAGSSWGSLPADLNTGCSGGGGATYLTSLALAPAGGASGAGVQLSAAGTLTVNGKVSTNGGGGRAPTAGAKLGGGGGGSGGAILLEGNVVNITSTALITAQGGAGASGGTDSAGDATQDGENGHDSDGDKANGGQAHGQAGNGGDGSSKNSSSASSGDSAQDMTAGGGGGGGGYGRIYLHGAMSCMKDGSALVAPNASGNCP